MSYEVTPELLHDIKVYLAITWDDEITDERISGLAVSGMYYLDSKYGGEADYGSAGFPRMLLMEYVRYARDSALDVFENNYTALILAMQNEKRMGDYEGVSSTESDA